MLFSLINTASNKQQTTMKLNQATAAAFLSATFPSSSLAASVSSPSHEELKDKIAPLLSSNHNYLHRMLQELTEQCSADIEAFTTDIEAALPTFVNAVDECILAQTQSDMEIRVGATSTIAVDINYSACDSSLLEACTADNSKLDRGNHYLVLIVPT